jgi:hypothetical protein
MRSQKGLAQVEAGSSVPFRYDKSTHEYTALDTGEILPHITGLLTQAGLTPDWFYTDEHRHRGSMVHALTARYDLGATDLRTLIDSGNEDYASYAGYVQAHIEAMRQLQPEIVAVEEPAVHPRWRYGGCPDRVWRLAGAVSVCEIKTGAYHQSHGYQTALQVALLEHRHRLPARHWKRFGLYLKSSGRFSLLEFRDQTDFRITEDLIRTCHQSR